MASEFSQLPRNVDQAYERILDKSKDRSMVQKVLAIILAASRPLTLSETRVAIEADESTKTIEDLDLEPEEDFKSRLRSWCGLFVSIHHDRIYFLHQTAREFLLAEMSLSRPIERGLQWRGSTTMKDAHTSLAECCVRFLGFFDHGDSVATDQIQTVDENPFLEYSANHWGVHLRESRICDDAGAAIAPLTWKLSDPDAEVFAVWLRIYRKSNSLEVQMLPTRLIVACYFGHVAVAKRSLEEGAGINAQGGPGENALEEASSKGYEQMVRLLTEKGANINAGGSSGTALQIALEKGHEGDRDTAAR